MDLFGDYDIIDQSCGALWSAAAFPGTEYIYYVLRVEAEVFRSAVASSYRTYVEVMRRISRKSLLVKTLLGEK